MKLKVRDVMNTEVEVEISADATILSLKQEVEKKMPKMTAESVSLIHRGCVLSQNNQLISATRISDGDSLVAVMPKQRKPAAAAPSAGAPAGGAEASAPPSSVSSSSSSAVPAHLSVSGVPPTNAADARLSGDATTSGDPTSTGAVTANGPVTRDTAPVNGEQQPLQPTGVAESNDIVTGESALLMGDSLREVTDRICSMGFDRNDVARAMRAAFNNPERAVEYLASGNIPADADPTAAGARPGQPPYQQQQQAVQQLMASQQQQRASDPPSSAPVDAGAVINQTGEGNEPELSTSAMEAIRQHPLFEHFRSAVQSNPSLFPSMLEMLASNSPELGQYILENQREFATLMAEEADAGVAHSGGGGVSDSEDDESISEDQLLAGTAAVAGGGGAAVPTGGGAGDSAASLLNSLTPAQTASIRNLEGLGFSAVKALRALIVSDWNEERAANFLFEDINEEEEQ